MDGQPEDHGTMDTEVRESLGYCDGCNKELFDGDNFCRGEEGMGWCAACIEKDEEAAFRNHIADLDKMASAPPDGFDPGPIEECNPEFWPW